MDDEEEECRQCGCVCCAWIEFGEGVVADGRLHQAIHPDLGPNKICKHAYKVFVHACHGFTGRSRCAPSSVLCAGRYSG